ncbi:hypothetical protein C0Q70_01349 [Pomacea canaliculata]|uniref:Uncharacterized protein n=1 Tax=Pomacea canaliculata TaxID=400727 RepID=A0A2T7PZA3_POMCA|nr:hypothetical protein C0Q70_01349 [Pomacea canaliculata]
MSPSVTTVRTTTLTAKPHAERHHTPHCIQQRLRRGEGFSVHMEGKAATVHSRVLQGSATESAPAQTSS